jgi:hypothetical protein
VAIFLYTGCVVTAGAVLYADCSVAAGANTHMKRFVNTCCKGKEDVAKNIVLKDIIYCKDREGKQRRKDVITSLIKVKLRRLLKKYSNN